MIILFHSWNGERDFVTLPIEGQAVRSEQREQMLGSAFNRDYTEIYKAGLAVALIIFLCVSMLPVVQSIKRKKIFLASATSILFLTAIVAFINYSRGLNPNATVEGGIKYVWQQRIDGYDLIHYYLVPKYFRELSYFRLYPAVLTADLENGGPYFKLQPSRAFILFQDFNDYFWVSSKEYLSDLGWQEQVKSHFSTERWKQFSHDFLYLQRIADGGLGRSTWNDMLWDHGFNGTPAWVGFSHWVTNAVPVEEIKLLCLIDPILIALSFIAVWWSFGLRAALIYFIYFFISYSTRWPTISWAFGRYDYVSLLVLALCFIKKGKMFLGGLCGGLSADFRIFPGIWFLGPLVSGFYKKNRRYVLTFLLGAALVSVFVWGSALFQFGGLQVTTYLKKMASHTSIKNLSSMREGFALALAYDADITTERINPKRRESIEKQTPIRIALALILLISFCATMKRLPLYESFAYGFIPFFLIFTASYYYYIVRVTLIVMHAGELSKTRHKVSLIYLLLIEAVSNWLSVSMPFQRVMHIGVLGWMLLGYVFLTFYLLLREDRLESHQKSMITG